MGYLQNFHSPYPKYTYKSQNWNENNTNRQRLQRGRKYKSFLHLWINRSKKLCNKKNEFWRKRNKKRKGFLLDLEENKSRICDWMKMVFEQKSKLMKSRFVSFFVFQIKSGICVLWVHGYVFWFLFRLIWGYYRNWEIQCLYLY